MICIQLIKKSTIMTTRHTISLPEKMSHFVTKQIDTGRYASVSDYMRSLIRNDQDKKELAFEELRLLIKEGEKGEAVPFSMDDIIKSAKEKMDV